MTKPFWIKEIVNEKFGDLDIAIKEWNRSTIKLQLSDKKDDVVFGYTINLKDNLNEEVSSRSIFDSITSHVASLCCDHEECS